MSNKRIRKLFEQRLVTWAEANDYPVQIENVAFTQSDVTHVKCYLLPANTTSEMLEGNHRGYRGIFQIVVSIPQGTGSGDATTMEDAIKDLFPVNLQLTNDDGFMVSVITPVSAAPAIQGVSAYLIPLRFTYRADTT